MNKLRGLILAAMVVLLMTAPGYALMDYTEDNSTNQGQGQGQQQGQVGINDQDQGQQQGQIGINDQDQGQQQGQIGINDQDQGQQQGIADSGNATQGQIGINEQDQGQGQGQGQDQGQAMGQGQIGVVKTKTDVTIVEDNDVTLLPPAIASARQSGQQGIAISTPYGGASITLSEESKKLYDAIQILIVLYKNQVLTEDQFRQEAWSLYTQLRSSVGPDLLLGFIPITDNWLLSFASWKFRGSPASMSKLQPKPLTIDEDMTAGNAGYTTLNSEVIE